MNTENTVDLYRPVFSSAVGPPPIVVRAVVTTNNDAIVGGVPQTAQRVENYVLISSLPRELQEKVKTAIQALLSGM